MTRPRFVWWGLAAVLLVGVQPVSAQIVPAPGGATGTTVATPAGGATAVIVIDPVTTSAAAVLTTAPATGRLGLVDRPYCATTSGGVDTSDTVLGTCKQTIANAVSLTAPTLSTTDPYTAGGRIGLRITTSTTTQILAGAAATKIRIFGGSICVDAAGVQTTVTLQDSSLAPVDVFSNSTTLIPYQLSPGQCLSLTPPAIGTFTGNPTTTAKDLQIVTAQAGPVNVVVYLRRE